MKFSVVFEHYVPESAEHGEAGEAGYEMENVTLREAYDFLKWNGGHCELCNTILMFYGEADHRDGSQTNYGLHFPRNLTASTRRRIAKLFRCYGVK